MKLKILILPLICAGILQADPLRVGVSVLPLESVVKEIGGAHVEVQSLQREGDSCSVFEPRPSVISWLSTADLFFRVGAGYESSILVKVEKRFERLKVYDLRDIIEVLSMQEHAHHGHDHAEHECSMEHGDGTDPHIWLDPVRLAAMAGFIADKLSKAIPESAVKFEQRASAFRKRALALHERLEASLHPYHGRSFYVYHPSFNYFAQRYDLEQVAISAPSHSPTVKELHHLITRARADQARVIFVQPQESRRQAEIVARAVGATVVEIDPMAADWENCIDRIGKQLITAFKQQ